MSKKPIGVVGSKFTTPRISKGIEYIHLKTGNIYTLVSLQVIDATNGREDDNTMVLYKRKGQLFVRESQEFHQKFKLK